MVIVPVLRPAFLPVSEIMPSVMGIIIGRIGRYIYRRRDNIRDRRNICGLPYVQFNV
jgi:hypothetical protein